jgi:DNA-directed RNA polymerase subunit M/transcription elongation factor TFIIS
MTMTAHSDPHMVPIHARRFGVPFCPECGDMLLAPCDSAHVNENVVRHAWCCEVCGYAFRTSVRLMSRPRRESALS